MKFGLLLFAFSVVLIAVLALRIEDRRDTHPLARGQPAPEMETAPRGYLIPVISKLSSESPTERWRALQSLGRDLRPAEIEALYEFLRDPSTDTNGPTRGMLKNEVIRLLQEQVAPPPDLTEVLLEIANNRAQDDVLRDHCLQHLIAGYQRAPNRRAIREGLWRALEEGDSRIGATALLGLHRLTGIAPEIDTHRLAEAALRMMRCEGCDEHARITAIQVCADRNVTAALPTISEFTTSGRSLPLRISAVSALGNLGRADDVQTLEQLQSESNPVLRTVADSALRKLKKRLEGKGEELKG